jgi:L-ascorbate metabolism protein UlaG (beta-lactamase superfamily)
MAKRLIPCLFVFAVAAVAQPAKPSDTVGAFKITPIRHASLMLETGGKVIHVDPWSQANYDGLPHADLILITDTHGDHLDLKAIERIRKPGTPIIAPAAAQAQIPGATKLDNGGVTTQLGIRIEAVPMYNLKRGPAEGKVYHEKGRGNGYVLTAGGTRVYIAGDTENIPEMRDLKNVDVAFIPMNLPYTMTPEEAAEAVKAFKPRIVYAYHYRGSDTNAFASALAGSGIEVRSRNWYAQ